MIRSIPLDLIDECWPIVAPMLEPALEFHPHLDIDDLLGISLAGRAELFVLITDKIQAAFLLERVAYPKHAVANMLALGGRYGTLEHIVKQVIPQWRAWAIKHHCDRIGMTGRIGWKNLAIDNGECVRLVTAWTEV